VEGRAKQGGQVYMPRDIKSPLILSDVPNDNLRKQFVAMPCLAMHKVPADRQPQCISFVHPDKPEVFVRKYSRDSQNFYLETDVDYSPRNPETFEEDVSFYIGRNSYFPDYYTFESVNMRDQFMRHTRDEKIAVALFQDTEDFRNAASWTVTDHTRRRT